MPVVFFFEGAPSARQHFKVELEGPSAASIIEFLTTTDGLTLARLFSHISKIEKCAVGLSTWSSSSVNNRSDPVHCRQNCNIFFWVRDNLVMQIRCMHEQHLLPGRLGVLLTFLNEAVLCSTGKGLAIFANCLAFTCIFFAFIYEASLRSASKRLAVFADRLAFAGRLSHSVHVIFLSARFASQKTQSPPATI